MDDSTQTACLRERRDIVRPNRLQGFSDAVFATAATLLIIPIRKFEPVGDESLRDALLKRWPELVIFILGFLVICAVWESHNMRFILIKKIDDIIVALTLMSLMITTFLPFTVALEGHYGRYPVSIVLNCIMLLVLELIELSIFVYAFNSPNLLTEQFQQLDAVEMRNKKRQIYVKVAINCSLFMFSCLLSMGSWIASGILLCAVIVTPLLRRAMVKVSNLFTCLYENPSQSNFNVLTARLHKERIECFSDAAIAIVATLLILDLTTEDFPTKKNVQKNGLNYELSAMWQMFVGYIGSYTVIAFLWFVHHSILHHIKVFTPLMVIFNNVFLAFLAGTPFMSTLVNKYTGHVTHNEQIAVRISCIIIFMASFMQTCILVLAILNKQLTLHSWAIPGDSLESTSATHLYLLLKTLIIPLVTFATFLSSLFTPYGTYIVYHVSLFVVPVLFIILKVAYACHCCRQHSSNTNYDTQESSSAELLVPTLEDRNILLPVNSLSSTGAVVMDTTEGDVLISNNAVTDQYLINANKNK